MRLTPAIPLAIAALTVAGCGGTTSKTATTSTAAQKPAAKPPAAKASSSPKAAAVSVKNFDFAPKTLTVKAGAKVTWKNGDATNHTVTFSGSGAPSSVGNLAQGASASRTFPTAGTYRYVCTFHPNMKATIVVAK
jgi:plastocyanin